MLYIDIFLTCHNAILNGILITRQSRRDKEYHFQYWFSARLTSLQATIPFNFEQPGRNTYPDFRIIQNPEGYEIKGLEYPGRYKDYDSNSQVPRGDRNGMTVFYVFGRYPKNADSQYLVHDLVICHGDFLNADRSYIHKNKSFRGFGSYGDILIRDRKMYVAPTPFGLQRVFSECHRVLKLEGLMVFTYHHSKSDGWQAILSALVRAGFAIVATHPIKSEMSVATPKSGAKEPIDIDVIIVCRKREGVELKDILVNALEEVARNTAHQVQRFKVHGRQLSRNDVRVVFMAQLLKRLSVHPHLEIVLDWLEARGSQIKQYIEDIYAEQSF